MGLGPQLISFGNIQSSFVITTPVITPVATGAGVTVEQSFIIQGIQPGDVIQSSFNGAFTSQVDVVNVRVSAANTLTVAFSNGTAGSLTYPSGTWRLEVNRPDPAFVMSSIQ